MIASSQLREPDVPSPHRYASGILIGAGGNRNMNHRLDVNPTLLWSLTQSAQFVNG
jgi:hypothetical protein